MNRQLGSRIRQARMEMGLSGTELARRIGKSQPYISDLERGQRTPSLPTLTALAQVLERPLSYFLAGDEDTQQAAPQKADWPERALPSPQVSELTKQLAAETVDQLLAAGVLRTDENMDRDKLVQIIHRALHNAYHKVRPATLHRREAKATAR